MKPLNFTRSALQQFKNNLAFANETGLSIEHQNMFKLAIELLSHAQVFQLPTGGALIDDKKFGGLVGLPDVRLPFPIVSLEYLPSHQDPFEVGVREVETRQITLAYETTIQGIRAIEVIPLMTLLDDPVNFPDRVGGGWAMLHPIGFMASSLARSWVGPDGLEIPLLLTDSGTPPSAYNSDLYVLFQFLNLLACSNVSTERIDQKLKNQKRKKGSLPFNSFHVLTVAPAPSSANSGTACDSARSPREHVRRGHIRRLQNGKRIWINAMTINPGVAGRVDKVYSVNPARKSA